MLYMLYFYTEVERCSKWRLLRVVNNLVPRVIDWQTHGQTDRQADRMILKLSYCTLCNNCWRAAALQRQWHGLGDIVWIRFTRAEARRVTRRISFIKKSAVVSWFMVHVHRYLAGGIFNAVQWSALPCDSCFQHIVMGLSMWHLLWLMVRLQWSALLSHIRLTPCTSRWRLFPIEHVTQRRWHKP